MNAVPSAHAVASIRIAGRLEVRARASLEALRSARSQLRETSERFVESRVDEALATIELDRLAESGGRNLRIGALRTAGYSNLAQVAAVSPQELARYPGVGQSSANALSLAVRDVAHEVRKALPIQITVDPPDTASLQLISALRNERILGSELTPIETELERITRELPAAMTVANIATHPWRYRFASRSRRARVAAAIEAIRQWKVWAQDPRVASRLVAATAAIEASASPARAEALTRDFEEHSASYYVTLETLFPRVQKQSDGLPQSLVERVEAIELRTQYLRARLRRYQEFGAKYALAQNRVLIGDEMGLGKTIQALAAMAHQREASAARRFLVVCPAAVVINWARETRQHTRLKPVLVHGPQRDAEWRRWTTSGGVAITTFDTLKVLDRQIVHHLDLLVVDEAHYVKNPKAKRTTVVKWAAGLAQQVIFLSGTPMQNRLEEFRNLVGILQPTLAQRLNASSAIAGPSAFRHAVAPVYLRRNVEDVAQELPEITEVEEWEAFSRPDLDIYRQAVQAGNFMWMRRAAYESAQSTKLERLRELCTEAHENGRKVIVFSFFRDVLARAAAVLPGQVFGPLTGDIPAGARQDLVDDFSRCSSPATLVAQITAGGEGLNIQAASVVILCEPQIKPAMEQQAIARAHRLGQTRKVRVHRLLVADSVDQRMLEILGQKQRLFDAFVRQSAVADRSESAKDPTPSDIAHEVVRLERIRLGIPA